MKDSQGSLQYLYLGTLSTQLYYDPLVAVNPENPFINYSGNQTVKVCKLLCITLAANNYTLASYFLLNKTYYLHTGIFVLNATGGSTHGDDLWRIRPYITPNVTASVVGSPPQQYDIYMNIPVRLHVHSH